MLGVSLFAKYFLHLKRTLPWGDRLFNLWLGLNGLAILFDLLMPYHWMAPFQILLVICTTFSALVVGIYCWRQQVFSAHIYVTAWACYVIGSILFGLNKLDFIPANPITENALQIGSILEIIILSLALADRLNAIRQEKIDMQKLAVNNLRRYELLYENALEGIFRSNQEGEIVHANSALLHHLGYTSLIAMQQASPNLFSDVFNISDQSQALKQSLSSEGLVSDFEIKGQRLNGEDFWAAISARAITDLSDNRCYYEGFMIDITERKQREKEILELNQTLESRVLERTEQLAQVNKELESFAYSVSHDLKAPLRRIDGFATMLEEDMAEKIDDSDRELLNRIKGQAHEMNDLIDGMLSLSRSSRGQLHLERINLSAMVQEICEHIRSDTKTHARFVIQPDVQAYGDRKWLHSALDNLLRNAEKFSSKKDMPVIEFGKTQQNNTEAYFVRDNGAGFNSQRADNLFVPFQRLHAQSEFEGTGIGLATVARIINRHQGKIWAEAQERKGATFYFSLRG
jgi:PAS domain S-box-containing protein